MPSCNIPEQKIVDLLKNRDKETFVWVYNKYAAPLYGIITKMIKDQSVADDVLTISFARIWKQSHSLQHFNGRLFIWMHNITRDVVMEVMNKNIRDENTQVNMSSVGASLA